MLKTVVTATGASGPLLPPHQSRNLVIISNAEANADAAFDLSGGTCSLLEGEALPPGKVVEIRGRAARSAITQIGTSGQKLTVYEDVGWLSYTTAWYNAVVGASGLVSETRLYSIDTFLHKEDKTGLLALVDDYWALNAENAVQARMSLKQRRLATEVNTPAFAAGRGYTFNGTSSYLNTGFIPATHAVTMTTTSSRLAAYLGTNDAGNFMIAGCNNAATSDAMWLRPRSAISQLGGRSISGIGDSSTPITDGRGFSVVSRANTTIMKCYKNGVALADATVVAGAALPNVAFYIGCRNNNGSAATFSPSQASAVIIGAQLSVEQEAAQYANIQALMTTSNAQM